MLLNGGRKKKINKQKEEEEEEEEERKRKRLIIFRSNSRADVATPRAGGIYGWFWNRNDAITHLWGDWSRPWWVWGQDSRLPLRPCRRMSRCSAVGGAISLSPVLPRVSSKVPSIHLSRSSLIQSRFRPARSGSVTCPPRIPIPL